MKARSLTEGELAALLRLRYPEAEYAFLRQCRNATGAGQARSADALVFSLWPSRGLHLHGFEMKSQRSDFLRELKEPEKAEAIAQYCDFWWIIAGSTDVAKADEMPVHWGLMAPTENRTKLVVVKQAAQLNAKPLTREFLAAIFRKVAEAGVDKVEIAKAVGIKLDEMQKSMREQHDREIERLKRAQRDTQEAITTFKRETGLCIYDAGQHRWRGKHLSEAVNFALNGGLDKQRRDLEDLANQAHRIAFHIEKTLQVPQTEPEYSI